MNNYFLSLFENKKRFFVFLLLTSFVLRLSTLYTDFFDVDESIFAFIAQRLLDGDLLYRDGVDNKPPFIFLFYSFSLFLFGKYNMWGVHLITIFWTFFISYFLYKIAKENESEKSGLFAALFYILFSTTYFPKYIATNINAIMMLPIVLSVLYWLRGEKSFHLYHDFIAGIFVGIAFFHSNIRLTLLNKSIKAV